MSRYRRTRRHGVVVGRRWRVSSPAGRRPRGRRRARARAPRGRDSRPTTTQRGQRLARVKVGDPPIGVLDQRFGRVTDHVEGHLGGHTEDDYQPEQHEQRDDVTGRRRREVVLRLQAERAKQRSLHRPQQVARHDDDTEHRHRGEKRRQRELGAEGADEHEELSGEAGQQRQPHVAKGAGDEHAGDDGHPVRQPGHVLDHPGVRLVVDDANGHKEQTGQQAVTDHLEGGAADAVHGVGDQSQQDVAHRGDGGVGDDPLEIGLCQREHGTVQHRENGDDGDGGGDGR